MFTDVIHGVTYTIYTHVAACHVVYIMPYRIHQHISPLDGLKQYISPPSHGLPADVHTIYTDTDTPSCRGIWCAIFRPPKWTILGVENQLFHGIQDIWYACSCNTWYVVCNHVSTVGCRHTIPNVIHPSSHHHPCAVMYTIFIHIIRAT